MAVANKCRVFRDFSDYELGMIFVDRSILPVPRVLMSGRAEEARAKVRSLFESSSAEHLSQLRISFEPQLYVAARRT